MSVRLPLPGGEIKTCRIMKADLSAANSFDEPEKVLPRDHRCTNSDGEVVLNLPSASVVMMTVGKGGDR